MPRARFLRLTLALACGLSLAACDALRGTAPTKAPGDFGDLAQALGVREVRSEHAVSGDAGCDDVSLAPTAIAFDASGLDQPAPVRLRVYLFRNDDAYQRRRADVDACAAAYATDPATFELIDASPFVIAGQGPFGTQFKAALRDALAEAAGD
ncbi:MAG: hypothetical protein L0221_02745 [Chloroflexi bacterium]|nr:hypothetical protein [Chloroflexota bacterium]